MNAVKLCALHAHRAHRSLLTVSSTIIRYAVITVIVTVMVAVMVMSSYRLSAVEHSTCASCATCQHHHHDNTVAHDQGPWRRITKTGHEIIGCGIPLEIVEQTRKLKQEKLKQEQQKQQLKQEQLSIEPQNSLPLPVLNSDPDAPNTLWLNFLGRTVANTQWNDEFGVSSYQCIPYDLDGNPATISAGEQRAIQLVWERVAEDYAPFRINVTTVQPSIMDNRVVEVLITSSVDANNQDLPLSQGGGVSYVGVFGDANWRRFAPSFVYYDQLALGAPDFVAEASSHEAGHFFGLSHDGQGNEEYYNGHQSLDWSWAPIMGSPYGRQLTQWSRGDYPGANNLEDDEAILASQLGWRADEDDRVISSRLALQQYQALIGGLSTGEVDRDVWQLPARGMFVIDNDPDRTLTGGRNLDITAQLRNQQGDVVWSNPTFGPIDIQHAYSEGADGDSVTLTIQPGVVGNPQEFGYDTYGNRGRYRLWFGYPIAGQRFDDETGETDMAATDARIGQWTSGEWQLTDDARVQNTGSMGNQVVRLPNGAAMARSVDLSGQQSAWLLLRWRCLFAASTDVLRVSYFNGQEWLVVEDLSTTEVSNGWRQQAIDLSGFDLVASAQIDFTALTTVRPIDIDAVWVMADNLSQRRVGVRIAGRDVTTSIVTDPQGSNGSQDPTSLNNPTSLTEFDVFNGIDPSVRTRVRLRSVDVVVQ